MKNWKFWPFCADGGLNLDSAAEKLSGSVDAFHDLAQFVQNVVDFDLDGIREMLQWTIMVSEA